MTLELFADESIIERVELGIHEGRGQVFDEKGTAQTHGRLGRP